LINFKVFKASFSCSDLKKRQDKKTMERKALSLFILVVAVGLCLAKPAEDREAIPARRLDTYEKRHQHHSEFVRGLAARYRKG
jgi:hypothetical protein